MSISTSAALRPGKGNAGITINKPLDGCVCDSGTNTTGWIDMETASGRAMYSTALMAYAAGKSVYAIVEDGKGGGTAGNVGVTHTAYYKCQLKTLITVPE